LISVECKDTKILMAYGLFGVGSNSPPSALLVGNVNFSGKLGTLL